MSDTMKQTLAQELMSIKSGLGEIIELVDSWVLSLTGERDRRKLLEDVALIIRERGSGLSGADRDACLTNLATILGSSDSQMISSVGYRLKLQAMFKERTERLQARLDTFLKQMGKILDAQKGEGVAPPTIGVVRAQEEERRRISREIHDGPAQSLASLTMRVNFCLEHLADRDILQAELLELKDAVGRSLKDIRRFIFDLRPMALDDLGLIPTLEQFLAGFKSRSGINVIIDIEGERAPLAQDTELAIFRVIQEAVNNAHRHAAAKSIHAFLSFNPALNRLSGVVKDDGKGFDAKAIRKNYASLKKLGLLSMEERILLAGGDFDIVSTPGEGTIVSFWVPL